MWKDLNAIDVAYQDILSVHDLIETKWWWFNLWLNQFVLSL